jgi:predicted RNA-binding protein with PIN domain
VTRWLVDGMNVIGSRPDGWWRDRPKAHRQLVDELARFAASKDEPVSVVFDGREHPLDAPPGVEVLFASTRGRNAADHDIAALVTADADPRELTVVTSDADLVDRVERVGARTLGAGGFRRLLDSPQ